MNEIEQRLNDLEIKFSYQDELINELNLIVTDQQKKITEMREFLRSLNDSTEHHSALGDEKPPHY